MINFLFMMLQVWLIIFILGRKLFFTQKEILCFLFLIVVYVVGTWNVEQLEVFQTRTLDLIFFIAIYLLEIVLIYRKKHSLFLAAIFTITQNTILAIVWTVMYDLPLRHIERRTVFLDSVLLQSLVLILLLALIYFFNKKYKFVESFLAINKKYYKYSLIMMSLHSLTLLARQVMLFTGKQNDYFYLTIILFFFSMVCLMIIGVINEQYKKNLAFQNYSEELGLLEDKNNLYQEFRHDYNNILIGLNEYLQEGQLSKAQEYLTSVITYSADVIVPSYYYAIKEVPIPAVQSILLAAIKKGKEANVDVIVDVQEFPAVIEMDLIDFVRCLSILINNAIEHASDKVYISLTTLNDYAQVTVKNTCDEVIDVSTMFKRNYSTKVGHSGLGLFIFQKILNSYTNTSYTVDKTEEWLTFSFAIEQKNLL